MSKWLILLGKCLCFTCLGSPGIDKDILENIARRKRNEKCRSFGELYVMKHVKEKKLVTLRVSLPNSTTMEVVALVHNPQGTTEDLITKIIGSVPEHSLPSSLSSAELGDYCLSIISQKMLSKVIPSEHNIPKVIELSPASATGEMSAVGGFGVFLDFSEPFETSYLLHLIRSETNDVSTLLTMTITDPKQAERLLGLPGPIANTWIVDELLWFWDELIKRHRRIIDWQKYAGRNCNRNEGKEIFIPLLPLELGTLNFIRRLAEIKKIRETPPSSLYTLISI